MSSLILTAMESPVEALAFDYLTFGILTVVNNLWTWVAVVTAAVSLWRFKVVAGSSAVFVAPPPTTTSPQPATPLSEDQTVIQSKAFDCPSELTPPFKNSAAVVVEEDNQVPGARKGVKFAVYYREEVEEAEEEEEEEATAASGEVGEWWSRWEAALRTRSGEKEWYRYQDLRKLNGNVVRLWDARQRW